MDEGILNRKSEQKKIIHLSSRADIKSIICFS